MKCRVLVLLFSLFVGKSLAQTCVFSGKVSLADSDSPEGIMVQLLDTTANRLFQFRTTDSTGYFKFSNLKKGHYKIRVAQFGYRDTIMLAQCNAADIAFKPFQLKPLSIDMEAISVVDKAILMRKSGDTTIFNLKAFESGSEQSVSDIMKKIPGFFINGSQYLFQNQAVKKILIDGKDIADSDHLEFTDAIHYKTVEDIRIIENYSSTYQPYVDDKDNEIAVDITLKEKYRNKYQGTLSILGGYNEIYDAAGTLINVRKKTALRLLVSSTNSDKNINQFDIGSLIRETSNDLLFKSRHHLVYQMNNHQNLTLDAVNFFDLDYHSLKAAIDSKLAEKCSIKSNLTLRQLGGHQRISGTRQYFSDVSSIQTLSQSSTQNAWTLSLDNYLSVSFDTSANLEIELPLRFKTDINNNLENGTLRSTFYENKNRHKSELLSIEPIYKFHKTFANKLTLSFFGINRFLMDDRAFNIASNDSIAGMSIFDPLNSLFLTDQSRAYSSKHYNNQIRLRKKIFNFDIQYNFCFDKNIENLSNRSQYSFNQPFVGDEKLEFTNLTHSLRAMYDNRSFKAGLGLIYANTRLQTSEDSTAHRFFRPNLFFMYRLNSKWNLSSSYTSAFYQVSLVEVNTLQTLVSQLNLLEGGADIRDIGASDTYNFSLFRSFEIGEEATLFNSMFSFIPESTEIYPVYDFDSFSQVKSYQLLQKKHQMRVQLQYTRKHRLWNYHINLSASQSELDLDEDTVQDKYLIGSTGFDYFKLKYFKVSSKIDVSISTRENTQSKSLNLYVRPVVSISFDKRLFQGTIWYQLRYNEVGGVTNTYHGLNAEFSRKKVWKNFELNLKIYDVLNIAGTNIDLTTFNPIYIQTDTYKSFPGQILAGLKWYFGS